MPYKTNTARKLYCSNLTDSIPYSPLTLESRDLHEDFIEYEYTHTEKGENSEKVLVLYALRIGVPIPSWQTYPITMDATQLGSDKEEKIEEYFEAVCLGVPIPSWQTYSNFQLMPTKMALNTPTSLLSKVTQIRKTVFQQYQLGYLSWHGKIIQLSHMTATRIDKILQLPK